MNLTLPSPRRCARTVALALLAGVPFTAALPPTASADSRQVTIMEADGQLIGNPTATLATMRDLGVQVIRLTLPWSGIAPRAGSYQTPSHFSAADPADYGSAWDGYDTIIRDAAADGITIELNPTGNAPLWATAKGDRGHGNWEPNVDDYGAFVKAVGTRYDGHYTPKGESSPLPKVTYWSLWNEPNYGPDIAPQGLPGHRGLLESSGIYRQLVDHGWAALKSTGHTTSGGTILIGELAPRSNGGSVPGRYNMVAPLLFTRALYCLGANDKRLTGTTAKLEGCPTSASGSRSFAAENPGLFHASGFSDHPYMSYFQPDHEENFQHLKDFSAVERTYSTLATIGYFQSGLSHVLAAYGDHRAMPIWDTEFGYQTKPPAHSPYPTTTTAAAYDNWAEYISWKNPRIASFDQYLLADPPPSQSKYDSGIETSSGQPKPGFNAFRLPIYLPATTAASSAKTLTVWGDVRPARFVDEDDPRAPESVQILLIPKGSTAKVVKTITLSSDQGYFDTSVAFPQSGAVELRWTYPDDSLLTDRNETVTSRQVSVTVK